VDSQGQWIFLIVRGTPGVLGVGLFVWLARYTTLPFFERVGLCIAATLSFNILRFKSATERVKATGESGRDLSMEWLIITVIVKENLC